MGEWHAVRTRPGREGDVAILAERHGLQAYLPVTFVKVTHRTSRTALRWQPLFMGHVFVMLDPSHLQRVLEIDGVDDVVRLHGKPATVDADTLAAIRAAERAGLFDAAGACRRAEGEAVGTTPSHPVHAALVQRIRSARWSRKRMALLMGLLAG
jgi:hypothetical protein